MPHEVGSAYVNILPTTRGFSAALQAQISGVGTATGRRYGRSFAGAALPGLRTLGPAVAAIGIASVIKSSVQLEAQFSKTMTTMAAVANVPAAQIKDLSALAMKMGADTTFSANEAASAMLELAKGGMSAANIEAGGLQGTLTLAAASGTDLATASTIASNALNTFALSGKDMAAVSDALAGGANASSASVQSLGEALGQVGPGARNAGLSLQDTVGVLAAFDQAGIKGSDAGTSLKTMLTRLVPPTKQAQKAADALGLSFVDAKGAFLPVTTIAQKLHDKLGPLSQAQRTTALNTIFGSDATRAATVLMNEGAKGIADYVKATKDKGAAERVAAAATSGTSGALERLSGAVETAKLGLGRLLAPAIVAGANALGKATGVLAGEMDVLLAKMPAIKAAAHRFLAPLGDVIRVDVLPPLKRLRDWISGMGATISKGLKKVDLSPLTKGFASSGKTGGGKFVDALLAEFKAIDYGAAGRALGSGIAAAINASADAAAAMTTALGNLIGKVAWGDLAYAIGKQGVTIALGLATGLLNVDVKSLFAFALSHWFEILVGLVTIYFAPVKLVGLLGKIPVVGPLLEWALTWAKGLIKPVGDAIAGAVRAIANTFGRAFAGGFRAVMPKALGELSRLLGEIPTRIGLAWIAAREAIVRFLTRMEAGLLAGVHMLGDAVGRIFGRIVSAATTGAVRIAVAGARAAGRFVRAIAGAVARGIGSVLGSVDRLTGGVLGRIVSGLSSAARGAAGGARNMVSGMARAIGAGIGEVIGRIGDIGAAILAKASEFAGMMVQAGRDLVSGFARGIAEKAQDAANAAGDMARRAWDKVNIFNDSHSPSRRYAREGRNVADGFAKGIRERARRAAAAARAMAEAAAKAARIAAADRRAFTRLGDFIATQFLNGITGSAKTARHAVERLRILARNVAHAGSNAFASENARLTKLVTQRTALLARLAAAEKNLANVRKAAADLSASVRAGILGTGDVTQLGGNADTVIAGLKAAVASAQGFARNIAILRKRGLNSTALSQIIGAGVEGGGLLASTLAGAKASELARINALQKSLSRTATATGNAAAEAMYGAGVRAAQGLVAGLLAQRKTIEAQMMAIARSMQAAIKKALGIRSPSAVFAGIGANVADGLALGILGGRSGVADATTRLAGSATLAALSAPTMSGLPVLGGDGAAAPLVQVFIDGKEIESAVHKVSDARDAAFANGLSYRGG